MVLRSEWPSGLYITKGHIFELFSSSKEALLIRVVLHGTTHDDLAFGFV